MLPFGRKDTGEVVQYYNRYLVFSIPQGKQDINIHTLKVGFLDPKCCLEAGQNNFSDSRVKSSKAGITEILAMEIELVFEFLPNRQFHRKFPPKSENRP